MKLGWRHLPTDFFPWRMNIGVELVGGDTTRGPLNICVQILGEIEASNALRRDGARAGDYIWVSGALGGRRWRYGICRGVDIGAGKLRALRATAP